MKKRTSNMIFWIVMFICILLLGMFISNLIKENNKCLANPFTYGADNLKNQMGEKIIPLCSCSSPNGETFSFNNEEVWSGDIYTQI